ncbi:hypothetical protein BS17DRAFT_811165 [Gyrodon lividus]|nr:hypothetical protein BS17DRAFT_811165 [Gyrodon lividus]
MNWKGQTSAVSTSRKTKEGSGKYDNQGKVVLDYPFFPRLCWPIVVTLGQIMLCVAAWGFILMMKSKGILALPDKTAHLISTNPIDTTGAVTLIAVVISLLNKFLLSKAVKLALSALVTYPVSGSTLFFGVMLLRRRFSLLVHVGTVITILSSIAAGMLKPGWSTILKPTPIVLNITLSSKELDLNNIAFDTSLGQSLATNASADVYNAYRTMEIYGTLGGMFSASSELGFPGAFNFNGVTYNGSTGGILPSIDGYTGFAGAPTQTGLAFSGGLVPAHVQFSGYDSTYRGLSANYTVVQQGFSANVSCQQRDLGAAAQWGVVQFTGTYLRSGFSAQGNFPDDVIPSDMATDVEGTMYVSTMGWAFHSRAFEYMIAPASIVAVIIFLSVCVWARYRWWTPTKSDDSSAIQLAFQPQNEVHRVVAVMAGDDLAEVFGGPIGAEVSVEASEMVQFVYENSDKNHGDRNDSTKV